MWRSKDTGWYFLKTEGKFIYLYLLMARLFHYSLDNNKSCMFITIFLSMLYISLGQILQLILFYKSNIFCKSLSLCLTVEPSVSGWLRPTLLQALKRTVIIPNSYSAGPSWTHPEMLYLPLLISRSKSTL